jgi:hypothetical protein
MVPNSWWSLRGFLAINLNSLTLILNYLVSFGELNCDYFRAGNFFPVIEKDFTLRLLVKSDYLVLKKGEVNSVSGIIEVKHKTQSAIVSSEVMVFS